MSLSNNNQTDIIESIQSSSKPDQDTNGNVTISQLDITNESQTLKVYIDKVTLMLLSDFKSSVEAQLFQTALKSVS